MSRGGDRERKRWGWLRDGEGRKGGIKGKGGMETSKEVPDMEGADFSTVYPCFPPAGQLEPECEAGLQPAVSCSQCSPAPGEERKSLLMLKDAGRQRKLPCCCTSETLSPKSLIMIGPVRFLRLFIFNSWRQKREGYILETNPGQFVKLKDRAIN